MADKVDQIVTTLGALTDAQGALDRLAQLKLTELPAESAMKTAYHVKKLLGLVRKELKAFEEQRETLVKELGEQREPTTAERRVNGGAKVWAVKPENIDTYIERVKQLREVAVEIAWRPVNAKDLGVVGLSIDDLLALADLVSLDE